jgi:hypothetical protein
MENVTVGWIKNSGWKSEHHVPTLWIGKRNLALGSKNNIDVVILDGYEKLEPDYIRNLEQIGYNLVDGSSHYRKIAKQYQSLNRFGIYEKYCFLRWLVLQDIYSNSPIIHYDGDIVFNETPENLENKLGKFTFVLQGCPAFVSIKDPVWLEDYKKNLDIFVRNIDEYSATAWKERAGWEKSHKEKWAGYRTRKIISSDQDFISHLIHTDRIIQDNPIKIREDNPDLILFQNPLYFFTHNFDLAPFTYHRENLTDYFNDRKVAFWHLQGNFVAYLRIAFILKYVLKIPGKVSNSLEWKDTSALEHSINQLHFDIRLSLQLILDRLMICKLFFGKHDFSRVFDANTFWMNPLLNEEEPTLDYPIEDYYLSIFRK